MKTKDAEKKEESQTDLTIEMIREQIQDCRKEAIKTLKFCALIHLPLSIVSFVLYWITKHSFFACLTVLELMWILKYAWDDGYVLISSPGILM